MAEQNNNKIKITTILKLVKKEYKRRQKEYIRLVLFSFKEEDGKYYIKNGITNKIIEVDQNNILKKIYESTRFVKKKEAIVFNVKGSEKPEKKLKQDMIDANKKEFIESIEQNNWVFAKVKSFANFDSDYQILKIRFLN